MEDYYSSLIDGEQAKLYFAKLGFKVFDKINYVQTQVLPFLTTPSYNKTLKLRNNNLSFHRYFSNIYSKLTKEDLEKLKSVPIFWLHLITPMVFCQILQQTTINHQIA